MLDYYNGSLQKALVNLFPEIRIDEASFANLRRMPPLIPLHLSSFFPLLSSVY